MRRLIQSALLAVSLKATAASPYLPLIGPPALRFEPPRVETASPQPPLPPLHPFEPKAPVAPTPATVEPSTPPVLSPAPATPDAGAVATVPKLPATPEEPSAPPSEPSTQPARSEPSLGPVENLTPQMFMKFFSGRPGSNTTGSGTTIYTPLPFIPPVAPTPPSSSATFQTTPPARP